MPHPSTPIPHAEPGPLSPQHLQQLAEAQRGFRRLRRTAGVAKASAWTTGVFAGITLLGIVLGDFTSLVLGTALLVLAIREGKWGARLALLDLRAPAMLAGNQLILGGVILLYALFQARTFSQSAGLSPSDQLTGSPSGDAALGDIRGMVKNAAIMFYALVGVGGVLATGLMALYYIRRRAQLKSYVDAAQPWILQVMRTGG